MSEKRNLDRRGSHRHSPSIVAGWFLSFSILFLVSLSSIFGGGNRSLPTGPADDKLPIPSSADSLFSAPDTAYFGVIHIDACDTLRLPLHNNSDSTIIIDSVEFFSTSGSLRVVDLVRNISLSPGERMEILIEFCPADTGCVAGELVIYRHREISGEQATHHIGIGGCGGAGFIEVETDRIDFGTVVIFNCREERFTITNAGNYPLHIESMFPSGLAFRILDPDRFPITIPPSASRTITVEFCPVDAGDLFDSIVIVSDSKNEEPIVYLQGRGSLKLLDYPTELNVGSVLLGACIDTFIVVKNVGAEPIVVNHVLLSQLQLPTGFTLHPPLPTDWGMVLAVGDSLRIGIRFCPGVKGERSDSIHIIDADNELYITHVVGTGVPPLVWLDTVDIEAGDVGSLTFRVEPRLDPGTGAYWVRLSYNHESVVPTDIEPMTPNGTVRMVHERKGLLRIDGTYNGGGAEDGSLFRISFRGLSTGEPENDVIIDTLMFPVSVAEWDEHDGLIRLSGCDVGRTPVKGKRAHIAGLEPNPAGEAVLLTYQAPLGRHAVASIFDARGNRVLAIELPEGTDAPQEFQLDLGALPRGLYLIELREREERSWGTLLIDR